MTERKIIKRIVYKRIGKEFNDKLIDYLNETNTAIRAFAEDFGYTESMISHYVYRVSEPNPVTKAEILDIIKRDLCRKL